MTLLCQESNMYWMMLSRDTGLENGSGAESEIRRKRVRFCGVGSVKRNWRNWRVPGKLVWHIWWEILSVLARETSSHVKKLVINIAHGFSRQNCRSPSTALGVPRASLIEVGMSYYVSISLRKDDDIIGRRRYWTNDSPSCWLLQPKCNID